MNNTFDIRSARPEDEEVLGRLWLQFLREQAALDARFRVAEDALIRWRNDYPHWLRDASRRLFVAVRVGEVVGFVTAQWWTPPPIYAPSAEVHVNELYVRPEARGQGAGKGLLQAVRAWAEAEGAERLRLAVLEANEVGNAFWQRHRARPFVRTMTIDLEPDPRPRRERRIGF
ncbi:MAG: GNAT family N-acetyltransferase [Bacteroidetes bacterium]|nr:MAG: GNAT family N-acetyltransferase [Bacteroidota bacterium]